MITPYGLSSALTVNIFDWAYDPRRIFVAPSWSLRPVANGPFDFPSFYTIFIGLLPTRAQDSL